MLRASRTLLARASRAVPVVSTVLYKPHNYRSKCDSAATSISPASTRLAAGLAAPSASRRPHFAAFVAQCSSSTTHESTDATYVACSIPDLGPDTAEELSDVLLGYGAETVTVEEYRPQGVEEQKIYGDGTSQLWDHCTVVATFPDGFDLTEALEVARSVVGRQDLGQEVRQVVARNWEDAVKAAYVPLQVAPDMWIVPEWSAPPDHAATNIILQPGVAFGTGEHPTTKLCLQALLQLDLQGRTLCDYGTGSGVLAIAALLRGATLVVGTDVDPVSVRVSACNAELSGVSDRFQALECGPSVQDEDPLAKAGVCPKQFDVVVANILRGPLLDLAPRLSSYTRPGGRLLLSGMLTQQVPDILRKYKTCGFEDFAVQEASSWACISATRSGVA